MFLYPVMKLQTAWLTGMWMELYYILCWHCVKGSIRILIIILLCTLCVIRIFRFRDKSSSLLARSCAFLTHFHNFYNSIYTMLCLFQTLKIFFTITIYKNSLSYSLRFKKSVWTISAALTLFHEGSTRKVYFSYLLR